MTIRYLIDENLDPLYKAQLLVKMPGLVVYSVGDPGIPPKGTLDPEILCWCEENGFILITLNLEMGIGDTIEELILIAEVANPNDYLDRIEYLPVT